MTAPYRMFSLVEGCPTNQHDGADTGSGEIGMATRYVAGWLTSNPGRWFLVGETLQVKNSFIGVDHIALRKAGFEAELVNKKVYARQSHASGVPLSDFVTRDKPAGQQAPLPDLKRDPFNWSVSEMRSALSTAREWLQGSGAHAAAA
jgi:hypothetical protein